MANDAITVRLTLIEARILWNVVDGQADAGACKGGNTDQEAKALNSISHKLITHHAKWKTVRLDED